MANTLNVEGKEYTAAIDAAKQFGYTKDYLLLLAKDGKIDGRKVGNKWYVHVPSTERFFADAQVRREERRKRISSERKNELKSHTRVRFTGTQRTAVLETLAIVIIGLSLGVTGYVGTTAPQTAYVGEGAVNLIERFAVSLYTFVYRGDEEGERRAENLPITSKGGEGATESEAAPTTGIIVAPAETFEVGAVTDIEDSFSDPVEVFVDPDNPDTGIVIPKFKNGDGDMYRFLMVPVTNDE